MSDFRLDNSESIFVLVPLTGSAEQWVKKHLPADAVTWGGGIVIEHRYVGDILDGITADGLTVGGS
jgi:hypothetical protein